VLKFGTGLNKHLSDRRCYARATPVTWRPAYVVVSLDDARL
jgi:hypothetical protein